MSVKGNVGAPARNVTRSDAMASAARSGSQRSIRTVVIGTVPASSTPFSNPETCAMGAGISSASEVRSPCTPTKDRALPARPRCVCSTPLGPPVEPLVNSTAARPAGVAADDDTGTGGAPVTRAAKPSADPRTATAPGHEASARRWAPSTSRGAAWASRWSRSPVPARWWMRRRHGTQAPAGPEQQHRLGPVRQLPGDGVTPADAPRPQAAGQAGHEVLDGPPVVARAGREVDDERTAAPSGRARRQLGVQRGAVPGTARPPVPRLLREPAGGPEPAHLTGRPGRCASRGSWSSSPSARWCR